MRREVIPLLRRALIDAMHGTGRKVTPLTVLIAKYRLLGDASDPGELPPLKRGAVMALQALQDDLDRVAPPEPAKRTTRKRKRAWKKAAKKPLSNAAEGSLHDKIHAAHRPGGKVMPRPQWSLDEPPLGGWDLGEAEIEKVEPNVAAMAAKLDRLIVQSQQRGEVSPRPKKRKPVRPPQEARPVIFCRRVLPWRNVKRVRAVLRCSRPSA